MTEPITEHVEPDTDDGGGDEGLSVHMSIHYTDESYDSVNSGLVTDDPAEIAEAVITCLRGIAAMYGSELQVELSRRWIV